MIEAETSLRRHPLDKHRALEPLREFTQASYFLRKNPVAQRAFLSTSLSLVATFQHPQEDGGDALPRG